MLARLAWTHVPPRPQAVPCGDGFTKSQTTTRLPSCAASFEAAVEMDDFDDADGAYFDRVAACPPYRLAIVVGGLSAELCLKTVKLASARYYDTLPTSGSYSGTAR